MKYATEIVLLCIATFLALLGAAFAQDNQFAAHMWVLFFALATGAIVLLRTTSYSPVDILAEDRTAYLDGPIRYGVDRHRVLGRRRLSRRRGRRRRSSPSPISTSSRGSTSAACVRCTPRR